MNPILIFFQTVNCVSVFVVVVCLFQPKQEFSKSILKNVFRQLKIRKCFKRTNFLNFAWNDFNLKFCSDSEFELRSEILFAIVFPQNEFQIHNWYFGCSKTVLWLCNSITAYGIRMQRFFDNGYSWQLGNVCWKLLRCASFSKLYFSSLIRSLFRSFALPLPLLSLPEYVSALVRFAFVATRQSWVASAAPINWTVRLSELILAFELIQFKFTSGFVRITEHTQHARTHAGSHARTHEHT